MRHERKQLIFNVTFFAAVLEHPSSNYIQILFSLKQQSLTGAVTSAKILTAEPEIRET